MAGLGAARLGEARRGEATQVWAWQGLARQGFLFHNKALRSETMKVVSFTIEGVSPISFSAPISSVKDTGEGHDDFEQRTWRERLHVDDKGIAFVPPNMIKNCLADTAKYLSESVPGKRNATYTKHFEAGLLCTEPMTLGVKAKAVDGERLFVPSDGKRGGGKRVWKTFPYIPAGWKVSGELILLDPILVAKPEKVGEYLQHAGKFIGIGRFRPRNNGYYGRFEVTDFSG